MAKILHAKILLMAIAIALMVCSAYAVPVTSLSGGSVVSFPDLPDYDWSGPGPHSVGLGITWSSTFASAVYGYNGGYGFNHNGVWTDSFAPMAGLNTAEGEMTFTFSTPVQGVGGFINYADETTTAPITIAVYDSDKKLIESETLTFTTGGADNSGEFHGFIESSPVIRYFTLSNGYIGITDLTTASGSTSAPEFPSMLLPVTMILGFLGIVMVISKTRNL